MNVGTLMSQTWVAPIDFRSATCAGLRTMLTRPIPFLVAELDQHLPQVRCRRRVHERLVAFAAHRLHHAEGRERIDETRSAVSAGVVPSGSSKHCAALIARYWAYIAPPRMATVLPSSACAAGDDPALSATPAPSLPTGIG